MNVVIIGSGNVATVLGKLMVQKGHHISQIYSQTLSNAEVLAGQTGAAATSDLEKISTDADLYLIAVADNAIAGVAEYLKLNHRLVIHTSGVSSINLLKNCSSRYGVLWPLQTLRKEVTTLPEIPFVVDGSDKEVIAAIMVLAHQLSGMVTEAGEAKRQKMHLAAVFASNFVNHLYALTEEFCEKEQIDFHLLAPIIRETGERIWNYSPSAVQTGPAIRRDNNTIENHLRLLKQYPFLHELYITMSNNIMQRNPSK